MKEIASVSKRSVSVNGRARKAFQTPEIFRFFYMNIFLISFVFLISALFSSTVLATPGGAGVQFVTNETWTPPGGTLVNTSGGSISTILLNATNQNLRWKAYVGNVSGSYVLEDASGYRIYDWTLSTVSGEVYATRTSGAVSWPTISCADNSEVELENIAMNHSSEDDNITSTFKNSTHTDFFVGSVEFSIDECGYTAFTYVNNQSQGSSFDEILLHDGSSLVYTTLIESSATGFDSRAHDFQMIVPERGYDGWSSSTPYYFYVELT